MQQIMWVIFLYILLQTTTSLQFYSHKASSLRNPSWMALLDNGIPLRQLSIIGSHSSMSQGTWGDAFQTQSNSLTNQMTMGMRALDIRCRHMNDQLKIYDRIIYLNTDLAGVLTTVRSYLQTYTMQVILMHIVQEGSPSGNTGTFQSAFLSYYNNFLDIIWTPTTQNPVLGEVRGKVVIIQDFVASAIHGLLYSTFTVLPHKKYSTNWDQYDKWLAVKSFLVSANSAGISQLSFWTGNVGSFPYFVASGQSSPNNGDPLLATGLTTPGFKSSYPDFPRVACFIGICTIAFQGINNLAFNYIISKSIAYTGIVFTDFIGDDIISKSISMNTGKFVPCPNTQITQGCSYCSNTGQCLGCNTTLHYIYNTANLSCLAASGYYLLWSNATANTPTLCNVSMPGCLTCSSNNVCLTCDVLAHYLLQNGACIAAPGYYLNASSVPVVCTLVGCYQCLSATVCSNCSITLNYILNNSTNLCVCDSAGFFVQNAAIPACLCMVGYYLSPNNTCQTIPVCPANNSGCLTCNMSVPACTLCDAPNQFISDTNNPALCTCRAGYFYDGNTCTACSLTLNDACLSCASQNLCLSCQTNFTLTNGNCVCQSQYYSYNTSTCLMCEVGCLMCTSATMCQVCDTANNFTTVNNLCECLTGMYLSGTVCVPCGAMSGCLACTMTGCTSCDPVFGFSLDTTSQLCECAVGYYINQMNVCAQCTQLGCLACDSLTVCTNCSVEFNLSNGVCLQVCGDGVLYTLPCDDGNLINGDGCSSTCQIETDYTCVGGSTTSASACSFSGTININIVSMTKDPSANKVYLFATIQPALAQLSSLDFTTVFLPDFPVETTTTTYDPNSGSIAMTFTYNTSLNNAPLAVSFVPPATPAFFYMPVTKVGLPQVTSNNLALKVYSPQQYDSISKMEVASWAVSLAAVGTFLVCFFFVSKLMAIEMILIFQVAFAGLLLLQKLELFMVPLRNLKIVNGYNQLIAGSQEGLPGRISQISYKTAFLSNFSMDIVIIGLPLLVGGIALIIGKVAKKKKIRVFSYKVLKEWFFSSLLFVQIHLGVCLFINFMYDSKSKMIGLAIAGIIQLCIVVVLIVFVKSPKNFGEYKDFFKDGSIKKNWYVIVSIIRTFICVVIGYFSNVDFCGYVALGIASILLLGQLIVRPYESNIRPFVNNLILIAVLSIYQYSKMIKNSTEVTISSTYVALFLIGVLIFAFLFNLACMIVWKCQSRRSQQKKQLDQNLLSDASETKNIDKEYVQKLKEQLKGIAINTKDISLQLQQENENLGSARRIRNMVKNVNHNNSFIEIQLSQAVQLSKQKAEEFQILEGLE